MRAIFLEKVGDASKAFKIKEIDTPKKFKKNDVLIRHTAIGVNFFDVAFRSGQYPLEKLPMILGSEGVGIVEAVGSNVDEFKVGERVGYGTGEIGSYQEKRIIHKSHLVLIPNDISDEIAAASLKKGLLAHSLVFRAYQVKRAKRILVHAASGGVGQFLCQWARALGVEVIGVVGGQEKIHKALENGCKYVIDSKKGNFAKEVMNITQNQGVGLVYDGVGRDVFDNSLKCLWPMGICVSYGESSGNVEKLDLNLLVANSLYVTRPTLELYKANRVELALGASELFNLIQRNILKPHFTKYNFEDVAKAHQDLESRKSMGSLILKL